VIMMDVMMMCEIYTRVPACVEFQEEKVSMDIDREVKVRTEMMEYLA
jgi:hypothetical protein